MLVDCLIAKTSGTYATTDTVRHDLYRTFNVVVGFEFLGVGYVGESYADGSGQYHTPIDQVNEKYTFSAKIRDEMCIVGTARGQVRIVVARTHIIDPIQQGKHR